MKGDYKMGYELIATAEGSSSIKPLDEGMYIGVCTKLIDLGWQHSDTYNKDYHKIMLGWDIAGEYVELQDGTKANRTMWQEYTNSLGEKAALRRDLESWRGKAFTIEELARFNIYNLLGIPCQIQIIHKERNGKTYANISAIVAFPKGTPTPQGDYPQTFFSFEYADTFENARTLPSWITDKLKKAEGYGKSGLKAYLEGGGEYDQTTGDDEFEDVDEDDLPF